MGHDQNNLALRYGASGSARAGRKARRGRRRLREALKEWTRERVPLDWALSQNNLGLALASLGQREEWY